ncbi:MAG: class I SAM-dependent methyltransferase [Woeseiaceae bacterium]|nr:class I SAM-dependent methyltransferase [Woeseiaceae bacterium]
MPKFKDYFSTVADSYRNYRPRYPADLFQYLRQISPSGSLAWDCATGNGQAATMLAQHFTNVIATDASSEQIAEAENADNVTYQVATAESTSIGDATVDLTTVAQALHWFDLPAFVDEVRRVSAPGAALSVWSYAILESTPAVDDVVETLYNGILGDYWTEERKLVEDGYASFELPFAELTCPRFAMHADWTLAKLVGYLSTWSAGKRYEAQHGVAPLTLVEDDLTAAWGEAERSIRISWPLTVRAWRID